ncbi:MAG: hydrogenase 1 maturation protease [Gemmatimonadales bacterium]|nr:MAG: hydrogenase 1 maturation protease [Gemmatimonadales bacterium]
MLRSVVLGLGNPLMGDDGLGLAALNSLAATCAFDPPVELIDGGTWGMNLLPVIEAADSLLLLDAIDSGSSPGTLVVLERDHVPRRLSGKLSPHQIDVAEIFALATLRGTLPRRVVALGLQPGQVRLSTELSEPVKRALPRLVELAIERLIEWGHLPRPKSAVASSEAGSCRIAVFEPCTSSASL